MFYFDSYMYHFSKQNDRIIYSKGKGSLLPKLKDTEWEVNILEEARYQQK